MAVTAGFLGIDEPVTIDKRADTNTMTRAAGAVHREVVSLGSPDDGTPERIAEVNASNQLAVSVDNTPTVDATQGTGAGATAADHWAVNVRDNAAPTQILAVTNTGHAKVTNDSADALHVQQATAANLNATVVGDGTFAVQDSQKLADNAAFTQDSTPVQPVGHIFDETAGPGVALTENDIAASRIDSKRAQVFVIEDETTRGRRATVTASNNLSVNIAEQTLGNQSVNLARYGGSDATPTNPLDVQLSDGAGSIVPALDSTLTDGTQVVQGQAADGVGVAGDPVRIAGKNGTTTQDVLTDASGNLTVDIIDRSNRDLGEVDVINTPTVNQGTTPWEVDGSGTAGTPAGGVLTVQGVASMTPVNTDIGDFTGRTIRSADINDGASGDNTIVALVASRRIKVFAVNFSATGTVNAKWKSGAATDLTGDNNFQAREGYTIAVTPPAFLFGTAAGEALVLNLSAAVATDGWVSYWDDDTT
jgi:hypothetical protein